MKRNYFSIENADAISKRTASFHRFRMFQGPVVPEYGRSNIQGQIRRELARYENCQNECAYPDLSNLFVRSDVSETVQAAEQNVPTWVTEQLDMLEGPLPEVAPGQHCSSPYG